MQRTPLSNKENINGQQRRKIVLAPSDKKPSQFPSRSQLSQRTQLTSPAQPQPSPPSPPHQPINHRRHQRLTEITQRCIEYKRRFLKQLQSQLQRFDLIFKVNREEIDSKFETAIARLEGKRDELMGMLGERQGEMHGNLERIGEEVEEEIGKIVRANTRQQQPHVDEEQLDHDISLYAESIHRFYERMKRLESYCEGQFSEDIFNRVTNEAEQALKISGSPDGHFKSISFNNENMFVVDDKKEFLEGLAKSQQARKDRLQSFKAFL